MAVGTRMWNLSGAPIFACCDTLNCQGNYLEAIDFQGNYLESIEQKKCEFARPDERHSMSFLRHTMS